MKIYIVLPDIREVENERVLLVTPKINKAFMECKRYLAKHNTGEGKFWKTKEEMCTESHNLGIESFLGRYMDSPLHRPILIEKELEIY